MLIVRCGAPLVITVVCHLPSPTAVPKSDPNEQSRFEREYQRALDARRLEESREKARFEKELESIRQSYIPTSSVIRAEV
jgi:hypothetical protein